MTSDAQQPDRGRRGGGTPRGVDPRSVGAAPAGGPFTASASSSATGTATMEHHQAMAKRRAVEDYEQTQHLGKGEAYRPMPQLRHWVPGTTRPAEPSEPPRRGAGQNGGKPPHEGLAQKVMKMATQMDQSPVRVPALGEHSFVLHILTAQLPLQTQPGAKLLPCTARSAFLP